MVTRLSCAAILSLVATFSAYAHDSNRIDQLEREIEENNQRLSILESMLRDNSDEKELVATDDGWESLANWRKLSTGMSPSTVQKILGDAHRVNGGILATWYYNNGGVVSFFQDEVTRWKEPR